MAYVISFISMKGGVGETTSVLCPGTGLADRGKNVLAGSGRIGQLKHRHGMRLSGSDSGYHGRHISEHEGYPKE